GLAVAGVRHWAAVLAYGLAAFVLVANGSELARIVRSYRRATGRRGLRSPVEAVGRNRRLSGGLVAHLGVAVLAISVTTSGTFAKQTEVTLAEGQATAFAGYTIRYDGERLVRQPQRVVEIAETTVTR